MKTSKRIKRRKLNLWREHDCKCCYCGKETWLHGHIKRGDVLDQATVEHIIPRALGGSRAERTNQASSCRDCNEARKTIQHEKFMHLRKDDNWRMIAFKINKSLSTT